MTRCWPSACCGICLRKGDILIADRAFGSYAFIAACKARGVDFVMRLHQARDPHVEKASASVTTTGTSLGTVR
jgi:hypothetical protein